MKYIFFSLVFFLSLPTVYAQTVEVVVPKPRKEAEAILKQAREETRANKLYFDEDKKCRELIRARSFAQAETSCRLAISLAEKLPKDRYLERSSAHVSLAVVLLWQERPGEAIPFLEKSLEIAKTRMDDTNAETGERYFLLGQANHQLGNIDEARRYYVKAEKTYRTAFKEMKALDDDTFLLSIYAASIGNILQAHLVLVENAGLNGEAATIMKNLDEFKAEFAVYLKE